jgi:ubiquinone/menaquinone biosynthesis C-methylase UbiE
MVRLVAVLAAAGAAIWLRRDLVVRAIRQLDRRGGLASEHGERAYARAAGLFASVHRLAEHEATATMRPGDTVLDIGSGPGDLLVALAAAVPAARVVGVEPSAAMREMAASRGVESVAGVAEALPFDDASVDLVVSTLSAHHWDDPVAAFAEIARVLRPGGEARIYDVRFAGYGERESVAIATRAGLDPSSVRHGIASARTLGFPIYARITIHP